MPQGYELASGRAGLNFTASRKIGRLIKNTEKWKLSKGELHRPIVFL